MEYEKQKKRPYAFDFDGVIARYDGFQGREVANEPIPEVVEAIRKIKSLGHTIIIHSTRGNGFLRTYLTAHDIPFDYINENPNKMGDNPNKPIAYVYVDDRAVCYNGQSADALVAQILQFTPHWKKNNSTPL